MDYNLVGYDMLVCDDVWTCYDIYTCLYVIRHEYICISVKEITLVMKSYDIRLLI